VGQNVIRKLLLVSIVAFILMGAEITGGIMANSLAILTDAAHMFSDFCGFFISIARYWIMIV
jgi:zinc transporter 2